MMRHCDASDDVINNVHFPWHLHCCVYAGNDALAKISSSLQDGKWSARLKHCLESLAAATTSAVETSAYLRSHLTLLQDCNTSLNLIKDTGFELALQFLASRCLANTESASQPGMAQPDNSAIGSQMPSSDLDTTSSLTYGSSKPVISEGAATRLSQALLRDLSEEVCHLHLALQAVAAGPSGARLSFPKFKELVTVLTEMQAKKSAWHSIVFVKERQSVHAIVAMLRKVSQLADVSFYAFTGRATSSKKCAELRQSSGLRSDGMKLRDQKNALLQFKQAQGRSVLVATASAEEGLDIINCELVVCYTVVETGREMMQKRGRARMAGFEFVCIVEEHDQARVHNAHLAEFNARVAQLQVSDNFVTGWSM